MADTFKEYTVYAIYNKEHNKIYIGQTGDLFQRLQMHNEHVFRGYTSSFSGEWIIIYKETFQTRQKAIVREKQLKSFRGREFIRNYIPR